MSTLTAPASARDALDMVRAGLGYLAAAVPTQLATEEQALVLRELEHHDAVATAARAGCLAAFTAGQGHCGDADYSPRAWLMHQTGITRGAAAGHTAWARRADGHRLVVAALAAGQVSESYGRAICQWTDKLPAQSREAADEILLAAAAAGRMGLRTWPGWPGRCTSGPARTCRTRTPPGTSTTGPCGWTPPSAAPGAPVGGPDPGLRRDRGPRCWMRCRPRPGPGTPGPGSSGITTRWRRRCANCENAS